MGSSRIAAPAETIPTESKTDPTASSGVCHSPPTTADDISRTQAKPRISEAMRARCSSSGWRASHMAAAVALAAVTCPEGKVSSLKYVRWTSGLAMCSLMSIAPMPNPA